MMSESRLLKPWTALIRWFDDSANDAIDGDPDAIGWARVIPFIGVYLACLGNLVVGWGAG